MPQVSRQFAVVGRQLESIHASNCAQFYLTTTFLCYKLCVVYHSFRYRVLLDNVTTACVGEATRCKQGDYDYHNYKVAYTQSYIIR